MDEVGDTGKSSRCIDEHKHIYNPSMIFGFGCSIVIDENSFGDVSANIRHRKNIYIEMKTRKLESDEKIGMATDYRRSGARAIGIFINKNHPVPQGWNEQSGSENHVGTLLQASKVIATNIPETRIHFIIDNHDSYRKEGMDAVIREGFERLESETNKTLSYEICRSTSGQYRDGLQTNDIVPHSLILKHERHVDSVSEELDITEFELNDGNDVWINGKGIIQECRIDTV